MNFALIILALALTLTAVGVFLRAVRRAPEAVEDEAGFHSAEPFGRDRVVKLDSVPASEPTLTLHHPAA